MAPNITEASLFSPPLCEDPARRLPCTTTKGTTAGAWPHWHLAPFHLLPSELRGKKMMPDIHTTQPVAFC